MRTRHRALDLSNACHGTSRSSSMPHVLWLCTKVRSKTHAANSVCTAPFAPISLSVFSGETVSICCPRAVAAVSIALGPRAPVITVGPENKGSWRPIIHGVRFWRTDWAACDRHQAVTIGMCGKPQRVLVLQHGAQSGMRRRMCATYASRIDPPLA